MSHQTEVWFSDQPSGVVVRYHYHLIGYQLAVVLQEKPRLLLVSKYDLDFVLKMY